MCNLSDSMSRTCMNDVENQNKTECLQELVKFTYIGTFYMKIQFLLKPFRFVPGFLTEVNLKYPLILVFRAQF